ncbi:TPA: hypothetical protein HA278_02630 [Candidatus Woesearchaeota archaeon]|nr:hypothetical protein [archaeon]HIJ10930.1 hypothetical protein [Candidatus Woesearchaeota archaeon]|tara:strand:+ start:42 stop:398 length:357 start_codon:yes stop_codon:yes gene_type:complete
MAFASARKRKRTREKIHSIFEEFTEEGRAMMEGVREEERAVLGLLSAIPAMGKLGENFMNHPSEDNFSELRATVNNLERSIKAARKSNVEIEALFVFLSNNLQILKKIIKRVEEEVNF